MAAAVLLAALSGQQAAAADPVEISFAVVSGAPGSWLVDFTFTNNLHSATALYLLGVKLDGFYESGPAPFVRAFAGP